MSMSARLIRNLVAAAFGAALLVAGIGLFEHYGTVPDDRIVESQPAARERISSSAPGDLGTKATSGAAPSNGGGVVNSAPEAGSLGPWPQSLKSLGTASSRQWLSVYRAGIARDASLADRYMALQVMDYCLPLSSGLEFITDTKRPENYKELVRIKSAWHDRCADLRLVSRDEVLRERKRLDQDLQAPNSRFSRERLEELGDKSSPARLDHLWRTGWKGWPGTHNSKDVCQKRLWPSQN
jgi:hypothetical protein